MAKLFVLQGAAEAGLWALSVILVLTTVVSYWYYLRVAWYMWMKEAPEGAKPARFVTPFATYALLFVGAGLVLLTGILPGPPLELALGAIEGLKEVAGAAGIRP